MKKILPLLFVIAATGNACAQNAKEIAVALLQHYTELADGSYRELNKQKFKGGDSIIQYDVPSIIEANRTEFTNYEDALKYTLTFYRNNPLAAKTGKEIIKALKILGDKEGYKLNKISDNTYILYKGAEKIMQYNYEQYVDIYPAEYLHFYIYANPPFSYYLADEKNYRGHYPTTIKNSKTPQLVQLPDGINSHTVIMNGIFESGKLTSGSFKLSGFDNFRNGIWLSRNWLYDGLTDAVFLPEGTTDTIIGYIKNLGFLYFEPNNSLYYEYDKKNVSVLKSTIPWLKNIYQQSGGNRPADDSHVYANAASLAEVTAIREAKEHNAGLPDDAVKIFANGDTYIGGFANEVPEGEGTLTNKNGDTFKGRWRKGIPTGEMTIHYVETDKLPVMDYVGAIKNYEWEGFAVLTTSDVRVAGNFHNDLLNGKASKTWLKKGAVETGDFLNGMRNGAIEYTDPETTASYTYVNDVLNGPAKIFRKQTGYTSTGNFVNGLENGKWQMYNHDIGYNKEIIFVDGVPQDGNPSQNGTYKNSTSATQKICSCCFGLGSREEYHPGVQWQTKDKYGNTSTSVTKRVVCNCCNGTGKVRN